jgi:RNA polymerase sigma factor (sigma-70 family)
MLCLVTKDMKQLTLSNQIKKIISDEDNVKAIAAVASKYKHCMDEWAIENCAIHAAWLCLQKHDPKYNTKFSSSLYNYMQWECKSYLRHNYSYVSDYEQAKLVRARDMTLQYEVTDCLQQLPEAYREILIQYHYYNMTLREIGDRNGYTKTSAHKKIAKAQLEFARLWNTNYYASQRI